MPKLKDTELSAYLISYSCSTDIDKLTSFVSTSKISSKRPCVFLRLVITHVLNFVGDTGTAVLHNSGWTGE